MKKKKQNIKFTKIFSDNTDNKKLLWQTYEYIFNQLKVDGDKTTLSSIDSEINKKAR